MVDLKLPSVWTPIAVEQRGRWKPLNGAILSVADARRLLDVGLLLMAQRRPDPVAGRISPMQLVVKGR